MEKQLNVIEAASVLNVHIECRSMNVIKVIEGKHFNIDSMDDAVKATVVSMDQ